MSFGALDLHKAKQHDFPLTEQLPVVLELLSLSVHCGFRHHQSVLQLFALLLQTDRLPRGHGALRLTGRQLDVQGILDNKQEKRDKENP